MKKLLYIVVRVPKSGSQSLHEIVVTAFPDAQVFNVPSTVNHDAEVSVIQKIRRGRSLSKRLVKTFGCTSVSSMWSKVEAVSHAGDIVSGHLYYGAPAFSNVNARYITLLRDPLQRVLSDYRYSRQGYQNKGLLSKLYQSRRRKVAARYAFSGYLSYLLEHQDVYGDIMSKFVMGDHAGDPLDFLDSSYYHFGILERIDDFAAGLSRKTGVSIQVAYQNRTTLEMDVDVTASERALVEKLYPRDMDIYHQVRNRISHPS